MADFNKAITVIEKNEGGYTDNPKDKGNYYPQDISKGKLIGTNRGITPTAYFAYYGKVPTVAQMKALSAQQARDIYKKNYWAPLMGDQIKDQQIATMMLDSAVNEGVGAAVLYSKKILKLPATAKMDATTVKKINSASQKSFFESYKDLREEHYKQLGGVFQEGWLKRLNKFQYIGGGIAIGAVIIIGVLLYYAYKNKEKIGKSAQAGFKSMGQ